jgi:hypothetical protein
MNASIFSLDKDLKTSAVSAQASYRQLAPHRDVTGTSFANGPINFSWTNGSSTYTVPNRSYLRLRYSLKTIGTSGATHALTTQSLMAPNCNMGHHLVANCEWRMNDKTVSRIPDYVPQVGSLHQRLNTSQHWRQTVGRSTNFTNHSFLERQADSVTEGSAVNSATNITYPLSNFLSTNALTLPASTNVQASWDVVDGLNGTGMLFIISTSAAVWAAATAAEMSRLEGVLVPGTILDFFIAERGHIRVKVIGAMIRIEPPVDGDPVIQVPISAPYGSVIPVINLPVDVLNGLVATEVTLKSHDERSATTQEICFQLPMSIWDYGKGIPGARHMLQINPISRDILPRSVVQSILAHKQTAEISFTVESLYLVVYEVAGPPVLSTEFLLDLETIRCQSDNTLAGTSLSQKTFQVSPSTYALAVAYQDQRVGGTDTRLSASFFRFFNQSLNYEGSNKLSRFFIQYAGMQFPSPDADPQLTVTTGGDSEIDVGSLVDFQTERYMQTMLETGQFYSLGEDIDEWRKRGPFYFFLTPRDNTDKSTLVQINQQFADDTNNLTLLTNAVRDNSRLLLFDLSRQVVVVTMEAGNVTNVSVQDQ